MLYTGQSSNVTRNQRLHKEQIKYAETFSLSISLTHKHKHTHKKNFIKNMYLIIVIIFFTLHIHTSCFECVCYDINL